MNPSVRKIDEINKQLIKLDETIIQGGKLKEISLQFYKIKKEFVLIETRIVQKSFNNTISNELQEQIKKTEKNIEIIEKYIQLKNGEQMKNTIDVLTYLNTVFLPLGLITGFFGMNFIQFGNPPTNSNKKGIFAMKNPHTFIAILFVISIVVTYFIMKYISS